MRKCINCHKEVMDNKEKYCPDCGGRLINPIWDKFAKLSKIFGILGLALCITSIFCGVYFSVVALVFGILGKKGTEANIASKGMVMGIIGIPVNITVYLLEIFGLIGLLLSIVGE